MILASVRTRQVLDVLYSSAGARAAARAAVARFLGRAPLGHHQALRAHRGVVVKRRCEESTAIIAKEFTAFELLGLRALTVNRDLKRLEEHGGSAPHKPDS